jgi:hypothetical protein
MAEKYRSRHAEVPEGLGVSLNIPHHLSVIPIEADSSRRVKPKMLQEPITLEAGAMRFLGSAALRSE